MVIKTVGCDYNIHNFNVSGNLIANGIYNGSSIIEVLDRNRSYMLPYAKDSIIIDLKINTNNYFGKIYNKAILEAHSVTNDYWIKNIQSDDVSITGTNNVTVTEIPQNEFFIPEGFSPNMDGINDFFVVQFSNTSTLNLEVHNRWGSVVYENPSYNNDWDGKGTGNFLGKNLPGGTYYCIYKLTNASGDIVAKGIKYITLAR
jgi:gliding motility-associated-like protein